MSAFSLDDFSAEASAGRGSNIAGSRVSYFTEGETVAAASASRTTSNAIGNHNTASLGVSCDLMA